MARSPGAAGVVGRRVAVPAGAAATKWWASSARWDVDVGRVHRPPARCPASRCSCSRRAGVQLLVEGVADQHVAEAKASRALRVPPRPRARPSPRPACPAAPAGDTSHSSASASARNSRPNTEAGPSSSRHPAAKRPTRRPITERTPGGMLREASSRPRPPTGSPPRSTNSGLPAVRPWIAFTEPGAAGAPVAASTYSATAGSLSPVSEIAAHVRLASQLGQGRVERDADGGVHVSERAHDQQPAVGDRAGHELEQQQGGLVGGVEVVEDDDDRLLPCRAGEPRDDLLEQAEPGRLGVGAGCGGLARLELRPLEPGRWERIT